MHVVVNLLTSIAGIAHPEHLVVDIGLVTYSVADVTVVKSRAEKFVLNVIIDADVSIPDESVNCHLILQMFLLIIHF